MMKVDFIRKAENYTRINDVTIILWQREISNMARRSKHREKVSYLRQTVNDYHDITRIYREHNNTAMDITWVHCQFMETAPIAG